ncbi:MAG: TOBE domain-containing protein [Campylobacterota bacterium]|nr:TOBE domain-containing protein [Campylobacterota bacterium]
MSKLLAVVKDIQNEENLNIIKFDFFGTTLTMMSLDLTNDLKIGSKVILTTKSTSIAIAKDFCGDISYSNQIKTKIISINKGKLLCSIELSIASLVFESIITLNSADRLKLKIGDEVVAFIKASELLIEKVIYD